MFNEAQDANAANANAGGPTAKEASSQPQQNRVKKGNFSNT